MNRVLRQYPRRAVCALLMLFVWGQSPAAAVAAPHTLEELFRDPVVRGISLSPDGTRVAVAFRIKEQPGDVIAVVETEHLGKPEGVNDRFSIGEKTTTSVEWLSWATPQRLLVGVDLYAKPGSSQKKRFPRSSRIYSVNKDGTDPIVLFSHSPHMQRAAYNLARIVDKPIGDPEHVLMPAWTGIAYDLFKVNILTGIATRIEKGTRQTVGWEAEDGRAVLRYDVNDRNTYMLVYGRAGKEQDWSLLARYGRYTDKQEWTYAGDAPGPQRIYVRTYGGADTEGIYLFDIGKKELGDLIVSVPGFDMGQAVTIDGKYAGASYVSDRLSYVLADPQQQKHFDGIDAYFGHDANVRIDAIDRSQNRMLLFVSGPQAPGDYYVYDIARKNLQLLMSARPWLEPERLAAVDVHKVPTRDGQSITSYLTWPVGERRELPLVVMPHGGPRARDSLAFDPMAQAFAAQGWLVVQPNFRGSSGYGKAFAQAGHRQWSKRMQDDVTDTVNHLVQQGMADPSRVVIFGASYGGYAALAGAVLTPSMYRAAASLSGVTDLPVMMDWHRKQDGKDSEVYAYLVKSIGDPKQNAAELNAASPRRRVAEIQVPVLLIHGNMDGVVPIEQSLLMHKALSDAGKRVRMTTVSGEGHDDWSSENNVKLMNDVIAFFAPHLAPQGPETQTAAQGQ